MKKKRYAINDVFPALFDATRLDFTRCIRAITHERDIHFAGEVPYFSIGIPISAQDYLTSTVVRVKRVFIDALQQHASSHIDQRRNRCNRSRFPVIYSRRLVRNRSTKVDPSAGRMHRWRWWERYILHFHFRITSCTRSRSFFLLHFFSSFSFRASFDNRGKENFLPFLVQSHTGNDYINAIAKPFAFSEKVSREVQL